MAHACGCNIRLYSNPPFLHRSVFRRPNSWPSPPLQTGTSLHGFHWKTLLPLIAPPSKAVCNDHFRVFSIRIAPKNSSEIQNLAWHTEQADRGFAGRSGVRADLLSAMWQEVLPAPPASLSPECIQDRASRYRPRNWPLLGIRTGELRAQARLERVARLTNQILDSLKLTLSFTR